MAHSYAHLFALPCTGLRFFTVYGPWGRPDMAPMIFADAISEGRPLRLFNAGDHSRDFTYVEDIAEGVVRASDVIATPDPAWDPAAPDPGTSAAPFRDLQHRQRRPGPAPRLHRRARAGARANGAHRGPAAAARRRARHLGRLRPARGRDRLAARDPGRGGRRPLRRLVPRLLRPVIARSLPGLVRPGGYTRGRAQGRTLLDVAYRRPARLASEAGFGDGRAMGRSAGSIEDAPFGAVVPAPAGYLPPYVRAVIEEAAQAGLRPLSAPEPAARPEDAGAGRGGARRGAAAAGLPRPLPPARGHPLRDHRQRLAGRDAGIARRRAGRRALRRRPAVPRQAGLGQRADRAHGL